MALTGTDVYQDMADSPEARQSLDWATLIVTLQPLAGEVLDQSLRSKVRPIIQSASPPKRSPLPLTNRFEVCVSGHLRPVKDPFRTVEAERLLPADSRIVITHIGKAIEPEMEERARREMAVDPRYKWRGERPHWEALRLLARSKLLVVSSVLEGGANVVSEAIACGVPIIHTRIPGAMGILGEGYPGYFEVGDTAGLASLLRKAETDETFYNELKQWCERLQPLVSPSRERECWRSLLAELSAA